MRLRILGSGAGGGVPQWNCGCSNCVEARFPGGRVSPRTQDSVAISGDGDSWFLINASPDVRAQIDSFAQLQPRGLRHSPIAGIVLTNADLDHCLGLLSLREGTPLAVYATERVWRAVSQSNVMFETLRRFPGQLTFRALEPDKETKLAGPGGESSGLALLPVSVAGKPPSYLPQGERHVDDNLGLVLTDPATGQRVAYVSAAAAVDDRLRAAIAGVDCLLFDGTFYTSDELIELRLGQARAEDMAHLPISGPGGSLEALAGVAVARKIYTHVNNSNPILEERSGERYAVENAGWKVAWDGMEPLQS